MNAIEKAVAVIKSVNNYKQLDGAYRYLVLFKLSYPRYVTTVSMLERLLRAKRKRLG